MKKRVTIIVVSVFTLVVVSLSVGLPVYYYYQSFYYPPVTIVSYELNPTVGEEWILNATTWVPNGCWNLETPTIDIPESHINTVFILIKVKHTERICHQMVVHFDIDLTVIFPDVGNWTVHCNDKTITIYVQDA
ncbi:MAG: hypothetical protein ACXABK_02970 [Candidatus Heimdallarchaeaceae archaeon]|jgi:hypothetical protein